MCPHASRVEGTVKRKKEQQRRQEGGKLVCEGMRGVCMRVIWDLALGGRLGVTLNATAGQLEVIVVDANSELIVVLL